MEPTKEQIAIKELSMAVYEQSKELARKDRKIEELQARLNAIHDLVIKTISPREDPITGNNIWIENRKAMQHTSSSGIA